MFLVFFYVKIHLQLEEVLFGNSGWLFGCVSF